MWPSNWSHEHLQVKRDNKFRKLQTFNQRTRKRPNLQPQVPLRFHVTHTPATNLHCICAETVREVVEFLEAAIHTILFIRGVYPPDLFVRRRKWDAPVYQSRHPALNEYIAGAVSAVRDELALGTVDKVVLVIKNGQDVALERFIFSLHTVVQPGPAEMSRWNKDMVVQDSLPFLALPQHFRAFLVKLSLVEAQLGDLPPDEDMSFGVFLELNEGAVPSAGKGSDPPPWIAAHTQHSSAGTSDDAQLRVIRALETGVIDLALAVQESGEKVATMGSRAAGKRALR